jgi:hypothetical protein
MILSCPPKGSSNDFTRRFFKCADLSRFARASKLGGCHSSVECRAQAQVRL